MPYEMKEIVAVIRPERWKKTRQAIFDSGGTGITQQRALGRGQQSGLKYLSMLSTDEPQVVGYLPKRIVTCVVQAEHVDRVVESIISANQSGSKGDGKIFVCPLERSIRIRTGEEGEEAL
jgi:nitrogen regulatory protein PII